MKGEVYGKRELSPLVGLSLASSKNKGKYTDIITKHVLHRMRFERISLIIPLGKVPDEF